MSRFTVLAASGFLASAMMAAPAFADDTPGHICHSASGAAVNDISQCCYNPSVDGPVNNSAYPFCPGTLPESNQYPSLDRTTTVHGQPCASGVECGPPAELSNVKPFYNSVTTPVTPQPTTAVVQTAQAVVSPPVAVAPPAAVIAPPVPVVPVAPVPLPAGFGAAGLGGLAGVGAAIGAVGLIGIVAAVANDDDDDNTTTTTTQ